MLQQKKNKLITYMIEEIEGGDVELEGDKGRRTIYGVSSRWYPDEVAKIASGEWTLDDVVAFYEREFVDSIARFDEVLLTDSRIAALLLFGKVHGTGIRDYTLVIQRVLKTECHPELKVDGVWGPITAGVFLVAPLDTRDRAFQAIVDARASLISSRISAVGGFHNGMRNRITKVLSYAASLGASGSGPATGATDAHVHRSGGRWVNINHQGATFSLKMG